MGERPIIRIAVSGDTADEFVAAATKQFRGEVFVATPQPLGREVRVEARFAKSTIVVRGDAIAEPTVRNGTKGVLLRLVKLDADSVQIPLESAVARGPTPAKHVVQRAPTAQPMKNAIELAVDDDWNPEEFASDRATKSSELPSDIAKRLAMPEEPTPKPAPRTTAKTVRRTPVQGVPVSKPPPASIKTPPSTPPIDALAALDAPTVRPAPVPKPAAAPKPAVPTFSAPAPAKPTVDDDIAFDNAFSLDDAEIVAAKPAPSSARQTPSKPIPAVPPTPPTPKPMAIPAIPSARMTPAAPTPVVAPARPKTAEPIAEAPKSPAVIAPAPKVVAPSPVAATPSATKGVELPAAPTAAVASSPASAEPVKAPLELAKQGELATAAARASVADLVEPPTSVGAVASSRASSEVVPARPRSRRLLLAGGGIVIAAIAIVVIVVSRGGSSTPTTPSKPVAENAELDRHLREAAARIHDGKLVGAGGDTALDHLLEAKRLAPGNKQVTAQLESLADTFEKLGDGAAAAGDLAEAATHFQAAITAVAERASAIAKLKQVEQRAREK